MRIITSSMRTLFCLVGPGLLILALSGCALPRQASERLATATVEDDARESEDVAKAEPPQASPPEVTKAEDESKRDDLPTKEAVAKTEPVKTVKAAEAPTTQVDPQALATVMGQLAELRVQDPQAHNQLLADLKHVDPKLWPLLVQGVRASLEHRKKSQPVPAQVQPTLPLVAPGVVAGPTSPANRDPAPAPAPTAVVTAPPNIPQQNVQPLSHETARPPADWHQPLEATIRSLESALAESPGPADDDRQVSLRMLYLMAGQREKAMQPLSGHDALAQEFWSRELYALSTYLDSKRISDRSRRAAEAALHHWEASNRLSQQGNLLVRNLAFCTEVLSYGVYTPFERLEFQPGQAVVLYAEVENYVTQPTPRGHHAALKSSYQILDSRGQKVQDHEFPLMEEHCRNPRRDFFIAYEAVRLPAQMYDGKYTLKLTIEDTLGHKVGQSSLDFQIKQAAK